MVVLSAVETTAEGRAAITGAVGRSVRTKWIPSPATAGRNRTRACCPPCKPTPATMTESRATVYNRRAVESPSTRDDSDGIHSQHTKRVTPSTRHSHLVHITPASFIHNTPTRKQSHQAQDIHTSYTSHPLHSQTSKGKVFISTPRSPDRRTHRCKFNTARGPLDPHSHHTLTFEKTSDCNRTETVAAAVRLVRSVRELFYAFKICQLSEGGLGCKCDPARVASEKVSHDNQPCSHKVTTMLTTCGALPRHRMVTSVPSRLVRRRHPRFKLQILGFSPKRQRCGRAPADRSMVRCSPRSRRALAACDIRAHSPKGQAPCQPALS